MPNHDVEMDPLVDALTRLAAPAEQQIVELLRRGSSVWVDELALGYDEAVQLVIGERGVALPFATLDLLEDVDELLTSLAGDPDAWTPTALLDRDEWRGVRRAAILVLAAMSRRLTETPLAVDCPSPDNSD